jgi:DNA ligase-associated putative exonuclease
MTTELLRLTPEGLHCAAGDFWVDPWRPVPRAVVTHAHSDHARWGCDAYLASREGEHVLRTRLGDSARIRVEGWGDPVSINGVRVSLHPAGHILGSAQVRIEHRGEVVVVSGDYKTEPDPTCTPWEPVRCDTFVTESTFGLPIYRWPSQESVFAEVNRWWRGNAEAGRASLILGYSLGKAQRILAGLDPSIGPIFTHGAVEKLTDAYRAERRRAPPDHARLDGGARRVVGRCDDRRAAVGRCDAVDTTVRRALQRVRVGVDADPRHAAASCAGPRLRPLGSRGLAVTDRGHRRHWRRRRLGHPWLLRAGGALAP